jgi:flagella basal body P-ring formation protein FlgA
MRNDYKIRPRAQMLRGGGIAIKGTGQALKNGGKADMITKKMSTKKKGKMMKGKR